MADSKSEYRYGRAYAYSKTWHALLSPDDETALCGYRPTWGWERISAQPYGRLCKHCQREMSDGKQRVESC